MVDTSTQPLDPAAALAETLDAARRQYDALEAQAHTDAPGNDAASARSTLASVMNLLEAEIAALAARNRR